MKTTLKQISLTLKELHENTDWRFPMVLSRISRELLKDEGLAKSLEKHSKYLQREFPQSGLGPCSPAIIRFKDELLLAEAQYQNEGMLNEAASGVRGAEAQRRALDLMRAMETRDGYGGLLD
jgi:AraC-like DNA-binding protein